jgi:hypothetical protein
MGSLLGPQPKLGAKSKGMQTVEQQKKKTGDQTGFFSPKLVLTGIHLKFWICLINLHFIFFIKSSLVQIKSCKSCELIPSLTQFGSLSNYTQITDETEITGSTRDQIQDDFKDNLICLLFNGFHFFA